MNLDVAVFCFAMKMGCKFASFHHRFRWSLNAVNSDLVFVFNSKVWVFVIDENSYITM